MNKMSKEKRDKLLLVIIAAAGIVSVLYFLVISDQKDELASLALRIDAIRAKRDSSENTVKREKAYRENLEAQREILTKKQEDMPASGGDPRWFHRIIETERVKYNLDVGDIRLPEPTDPGVLPKFPFNAISFHLSLIGSYTDFGAFLAEFENRYPYMRVQLVNIVPEMRAASTALLAPGETAPVSVDAEPSKLRFTFKVISLIKSPT